MSACGTSPIYIMVDNPRLKMQDNADIDDLLNEIKTIEQPDEIQQYLNNRQTLLNKKYIKDLEDENSKLKNKCYIDENGNFWIQHNILPITLTIPENKNKVFINKNGTINGTEKLCDDDVTGKVQHSLMCFHCNQYM